MNIAMISTPFVAVPPVRYGGTELVVAAMVEGLAARGHQVTLYATADSRVPARVRSFFPYPVWPPDPYQELAHVSYAMQELLLEDGVDLVHAHSAPALCYARMLSVPVIYTIHHARAEPLCDLYRATRASNVRMVCISERQREQIDDVAGDARVVYHGLDPSSYVPGDGAGGYAAFIGRMAAEKGPHTAIDVARRAGVPVRLAGIPHGKDQAYFRAEVAPRLEQRGVTWVGELAQAPKSTFLGNAVATLMPIAWEEPFGLVMIESMLCGTPVLSFPRGSAAEIIDPGVTGLLVRDADEMAAQLGALVRGEVAIDRRRCREHAERRFARSRMVDDYVKVYEDALGARAGRDSRAGEPRVGAGEPGSTSWPG